MKRDMGLIRAILLRVEEEYGGISITNLSIEGNSLEEVAVHCKMLEDAGLVTSCGINYADNGIHSFSVGDLTWDGAEYLDKIRDDSLWEKTKTMARERGVPLVFDTVKEISSKLVSAATEGAVNAVLRSGGML